MGVVVLAAGALWFSLWGLLRLLVRNPEQQWHVVEGQILHSLFQRREDIETGADIHDANVSYAYEYRGIRYVNDRITPLQLRWMTRWAAESRVRRYPPGKLVTVYVNPRDPGKSVLDPVQQPFAAICLFGLGLSCAGVAFAQTN